jgi:hypothetical protein
MTAISIAGLITLITGQPLLAEVGATDMPWFAQFGLCGLFGSRLWWCIAKTLPNVAKEWREATIESARISAAAVAELKAEMHGMRGDFNDAQDANLSLLRECLRGQKHP